MEAHSPHCTWTTLLTCVTACMYLCKLHVRTSKNEIDRSSGACCPLYVSDTMFSVFGRKKMGTKLTNENLLSLVTSHHSRDYPHKWHASLINTNVEESDGSVKVIVNTQQKKSTLNRSNIITPTSGVVFLASTLSTQTRVCWKMCLYRLRVRKNPQTFPFQSEPNRVWGGTRTHRQAYCV